MTKLPKKILGLFLAICMLASLFTCLTGMTASAASGGKMFVLTCDQNNVKIEYLSDSSAQLVPGASYTLIAKYVSDYGYGADQLKNMFALWSCDVSGSNTSFFRRMENFTESYNGETKTYTAKFVATAGGGDPEIVAGQNSYFKMRFADRNGDGTVKDCMVNIADIALLRDSTGENLLANSPIDEEHKVTGAIAENPGKWRVYPEAKIAIQDKGNTFGDGEEPGDYAGPEIDPETGEVIIPAHYHTGGTATCHSKAVCTVCSKEYGEFDANNHDGGTEVRDAVEATATEDGYTGDTYCLGCGALIAAGEVIPATGGGEQPASTDMIVWNGAPAYSRLLYRPEEVDPGTKYVLSFDMELTDITEENEPFFWRVFYVTEDDNFVRIPHADFDITKTALKHGYHYDVKFTVPSDCRDYNNILLKFGDTGANGYTQTMKLANLDLWSLDGEDNKVSQIELSIPATVDDILEVTETNHKNNGVNGKWVCPKDYLKNITVEPQNGYFDPVSEPACEHANTSEVEAVASTCHTAGHAAYTVCDDCGEIISGSDEELPLDPDNHDGGTEVRDAVEATATEDGYTGDTYCLGCGALIAAGEVIPATGGEQPEPSDKMFRLDCTNNNSKIMYMSTAEASFTPNETYTFSCKYISDYGYGTDQLKNMFGMWAEDENDSVSVFFRTKMRDFSESYDNETNTYTATFNVYNTNTDSEIAPENCYVYLALGDRNGQGAVSGTSAVYLADFSLICNSTGVDLLADVPIDEEHTMYGGSSDVPVNKGKWVMYNSSTVFVEDKGNTFGDGEEPGECEHTGGTATCHSKAVCTVCSKEYGEFDATNHDGGTEVRDAKDATETEDGYTGDTYCLGCGALIAAGEVIPATGGGGQPASTDMIVWNGAPAYSRMLYRPDTGKFEAGTKYVLSFDIELTDITEENEPYFWRVYYANESGFARIQHADFDITKTALKNGYHYDVKFTVPDDCRDYDNILLKFGDTGANGYTQTMKLANLDLWSLDGEDNEVSQIVLSIPATIDDVYQTNDTNEKSNGVNGKWVCPVNYLKEITIEPQNGYFDPVGAYEPGDINGDGEVDNKDLTRLFQYLSNWDVEVNKDALDVNGDGSVDNKDLTRLFQYLSNWDVDIF